ncbi:MAG: hypothetical protein AAF732_05555 [Pseudomonadota bacterium]
MITATSHGFGTCCDTLAGAMAEEEFDPLIAVGDDGILYMAVGSIIEDDDDEAGIVEHPVFFCPFCGTKLQDADEVMRKLDGPEQ